MTTEREVIKMLVEALENHAGNYKLSKTECAPINAALAAARALPKPEADAWLFSEQKPVVLPFAIFDQEITDLRRFHECAMDDEGYDVPKDRMKRLAEIGLVRRVSANYYEHTDFGLSVLNGDFDSQPQPDYKAQRDALLKAVAQVKSNLMHHRRFGDDTFQAWKNAAARAEGDLEEALASVKGGAE